MKINTVLGTMNSEDMGITLMHEHLINIDWVTVHAFPDFYDRESVVEMFVDDAASLKPYNVATFIDATPISLGRDLKLMQECSERTGFNMICCTGFYFNEAPFMFMDVNPEVIAGRMLHEVNVGIEGTDIKPGFLKCATGATPGATKENYGMILGTAMAQKECGMSIYTHIDWNTRLGLWQKGVFDAEGVDPTRIAYGHSGSTCDEHYLLSLAKDGSFICFDQFAWFNAEWYYQLLAKLMKTDIYKQIIVSCDAALRSDFALCGSKRLRDREKNEFVGMYTRRNELFLKLIPKLLELGVDEERINEVFMLNPRRFFGEKI